MCTKEESTIERLSYNLQERWKDSAIKEGKVTINRSGWLV
jgi:hypothetical protein